MPLLQIGILWEAESFTARRALVVNLGGGDVMVVEQILYNDPYGERARLRMHRAQRRAVLWKIDYYAPDMMHGSEDPSDPKQSSA